MKLKLTTRDLSVLENLRLDRLRQLYDHSLGCCFLRLHRSMLVVHCPEPWLVDQLMEELDQMVNTAWLVLGVKSVSICYAGEEVHRAKTRSARSRRLPNQTQDQQPA